MRLQLTIQRHGLPPVRILWSVAPTRPPLAAAGSSVTVSQFLEQVNDIIPLESGDWGLEDYAVEVHGFECLHFSELGQILKEEDEVHIRPLQTTDLRIRRVSGRHQISADGKHLIDGVAFGRAFLRKADRPPLKIPPRKRRRLTYDEEREVGVGGQVNNQQLLLRAGSDEDEGSIAGDESNGDEDFLAPEENDAELDAELADLRDDLQAGSNEDEQLASEDGLAITSKVSTRKSRRSPKGMGLLHLVDEGGLPFVGQYNNPLLDKYEQDEPPTKRLAVRKRKRGAPDLVKGATRSARYGVQDSSASPERVSRRGSAGSNKSVRFEDAEPATPATIRESQDSDDADDDDFQPNVLDESDKENAEPIAEEAGLSEVEETSASSSTSSSEQSDSDPTSSSGSSSTDSSTGSDSGSDSDSDSEPEQRSSKKSSQGSDSSGTSSDSSTSSSESEPKPEPKPKPERVSKKSTQKKKGQVESTQTPKATNRVALIAKLPPTKTVPPGKGKQKTILRNQRRKDQKTLAYLKSQGILAAGSTLKDLRQYNERRQEEAANPSTPGQRSEITSRDLNDTLDAKRQALLTSIANSATDFRPNENVREHSETLVTDGQTLAGEQEDIEMAEPDRQSVVHGQVFDNERTDENQIIATNDQMPKIAQEPIADTLMSASVPQSPKEKLAADSKLVPTPASAPELMSHQTPNQSSQNRRSKLDLSGAKRMLFGSLGLKTPKTKQDESKMRERLMKEIRPIREPQVEKEVDASEDVVADDSWREKIDLRAVECCHDGVQLSTPPFPFVQRWDPQQQRGYSSSNLKKRKGKKRKRNSDSYYQESSYENSQTKVARDIGYEAPEGNSDLPDVNKDANPQNVVSHDDSLQDSQAVNEQLLCETGEASAEGLGELTADLPSLPEDPTTCPSLTRETAKEGTIIAFKQLEMSAETNWQPNISGYRTAVVNEVTSSGTLQMTPAKRDRTRKQVDYDNQTGERLYSKFEMPGYNDEDDGDKLEISFDELINPVLVRASDVGPDQDKSQHTRTEEVGADLGTLGDLSDANNISPQCQVDKDSPIEGAKGNNILGPSVEDREEISELIRDAGWRSSIQPEVNCNLATRTDPDSPKQGEPEDTTLVDTPSPRFNGFGSSPVVNVRSSPPYGIAQSPRRFLASGTEIAESVPPPDFDDSYGQSVNSESRSAVDYPSLPQIGDDSKLFQEEAQQRSDPPFDHQIPSQALISNGTDQSPAQSTRSHIKLSQESISPPGPFKTLNGTESEDEFPEPFSQAWESRMSQEVDIKPEFSQENVISPPSYPKSKVIGKRASSQRESNRTWTPGGEFSAFEDDDEDDAGSTPRPSQQTRSSQVIDLTVSSDAVKSVDGPDNDEDSYKLPKGPGWVKKTRTSRGRSVSTKAASGKAKTKAK